MANDPTPAFDVGPLSWVQGEIDQALTRGLETIATFKANPTDPTALKHARAHVHAPWPSMRLDRPLLGDARFRPDHQEEQVW